MKKAKLWGSLVLILGVLSLMACPQPTNNSDSGGDDDKPLWIPEPGYINTPLDQTDPVYFYGTKVGYNGEYITLGDHTIYIDGTLSDETAAQYNYVYNDFEEAVDAGAFQSGTALEPMRVLIAPWVYWVDDPDDPAIRGSNELIGVSVTCNWLRLEGLTKDYRNVVIAGNRGQQAGANGNWTVIRIVGNAEEILYIANLTISNYCSLDLVYPLDSNLPEGQKLSRPRRQDTITQAHISSYSGGRVFAVNSAFQARHNGNPPNGTRTLYYQCHIEGGWHSLPFGNDMVYLQCDIELYGGQNAGSFGGVAILDSDIYLKAVDPIVSFGDGAGTGQGAVIDGRIHSENPGAKLLWTRSPPAGYKSYQYNVTYNGQPYTIQEDTNITVNLADYPDLLRGYKFLYLGKEVYNTYNLLRGTDGWDPLGVKSMVASGTPIEKPRRLTVSIDSSSSTGTGSTIITGDGTIVPVDQYLILAWTATGSSGNVTGAAAGTVQWRLASESTQYADLVTLAPQPDGTLKVTANNATFEAQTLRFEAYSSLGLVGSILITVNPAYQPAPTFTTAPAIQAPSAGKISVTYDYDKNPAWDDWSVVNWYRCDNAAGSNPVPAAVSRENTPLKAYTLTPADIGKYMKVEVTLRHSLSQLGATADIVYTTRAIAAGDIPSNDIHMANFDNFPIVQTSTTFNRTPVTSPGQWTLDSALPVENIGTYNPGGNDHNLSWAWGISTQSDSIDLSPGFRHRVRGARILYNPPTKNGGYGDMDITWKLGSSKTGQGFGSATTQFMDLFIKFDVATGNGYALRIQRTGRQNLGTEWGIIQYKGWEAYTVPLYPQPKPEDFEDAPPNSGDPKRWNPLWWDTRPRTSAFQTFSTIRIRTQGTKIIVDGETDAPQSANHVAQNLTPSVHLEYDGYVPNTYGGFGLWQNGTSNFQGGSDATTSLRGLDVIWN